MPRTTLRASLSRFPVAVSQIGPPPLTGRYSTSLLEIPLSAPSALTRSSTFRVETPAQVGLHDHQEQRLVGPAAPLQQAHVDSGRDWVDDHLERARALASVATLGGERTTDIAALLLTTFGDDRQVSSRYMASSSAACAGFRSRPDRRSDQQVRGLIDQPGARQGSQEFA
jgi:hypothetical protein